MKSWRPRETASQSVAGMWQVYAKVNDYWLPIGEPVPKQNAKAEVQILIDEGRLQRPHAVPL